MKTEVTGKLKRHFKAEPKHSDITAGVSVIMVRTENIHICKHHCGVTFVDEAAFQTFTRQNDGLTQILKTKLLTNDDIKIWPQSSPRNPCQVEFQGSGRTDDIRVVHLSSLFQSLQHFLMYSLTFTATRISSAITLFCLSAGLNWEGGGVIP